MAVEHYDLIVIGSGPAGEKGAAQAAFFGKKVALVEKASFPGGAAANTGTLPSKTLRETALFLSGFRNRQLEGLHFHLEKTATARDLLARERYVKDFERSRIRDNLKKHHVQVYQGAASFVDPHTIAVKPERCRENHIAGDFILIATGSYPFRPPDFPFHDPRLFDSDTILTLHEIPQALLAVGGGVIGCEYACMYAALGVQVDLVEKRERLLGFLDAEIAVALQQQMEALGVRFHKPDSVAAMEVGPKLTVQLKSGTVLHPDAVLVSAGRSGQTEGLGLDRVGIIVNDTGKIPVNEHYQTVVPHIYAAGDVIGNPALASTSMEQARVAMVHAFKLRFREGLAQILPYGIYTIPECSMAGETEETLQAKGIPYLAGRARYAGNARGQIIGDQAGMLKLLFHEHTHKLLGVHVLGEQATELVHVGLTALLLQAGAELFVQTCFNYPTLTEMYKYATYDALGQAGKRRVQGGGPAD